MATGLGRLGVVAVLLTGMPAGLAAQANRSTAGLAPSAAVGSDGPAGIASQMPVARLSHLAGTVTAGPENGTTAAVDAVLNMPLVAGTRLLAGDTGEAEVEFADGSILRLTPGSTATLTRLDAANQGTEVQLGTGLFYLELRSSERGTYTVYAGDVMVSPEQDASFRVRVRDAQVETAVLAGSVSVTRARAYTAQIAAGESLRTDPKNSSRYLLADGVSPESWDAWNEKLSQAAQDEQAARTTARDSYAGQQGYGWADLDAQGHWYDVPGEGNVWQPAIADANFDPYDNGAWVYGAGGYTWASGYGWGWLPYRCGAWSFYPGFGWGWVPSTGCLSFGFNGGFDDSFDGGEGDGGYRVRHAPGSWRPPHRPVIVDRGKPHPPLPVGLRPVETPPSEPARSHSGPTRIGGILATPLLRVGRPATPQGGSAVGSSLLRDFPVQAGTHVPLLGSISPSPVAVPGRAADWKRTPDGTDQEREREAAMGLRRDGASGRVAPGSFATRPAIGGYGERSLPKPTDPPVGANGAPPVGSSVVPPVGADGVVSAGANGTLFPGGSGRLRAQPVPAQGAAGPPGHVPAGDSGRNHDQRTVEPRQPGTMAPVAVPRGPLVLPAPVPRVAPSAPVAPRAATVVAAPTVSSPTTPKVK